MITGFLGIGALMRRRNAKARQKATA
ncbi:MAG: hypothetical protein LKM31_02970 [Sphingobium sp.]|nr:hypothetical protein [Sphingobium sp.]